MVFSVVFSVGLSLRLRFLVGGAEGMLVSASLGAGAVVEVGGFASAVAEAVGAV